MLTSQRDVQAETLEPVAKSGWGKINCSEDVVNRSDFRVNRAAWCKRSEDRDICTWQLEGGCPLVCWCKVSRDWSAWSLECCSKVGLSGSCGESVGDSSCAGEAQTAGDDPGEESRAASSFVAKAAPLEFPWMAALTDCAGTGSLEARRERESRRRKDCFLRRPGFSAVSSPPISCQRKVDRVSRRGMPDQTEDENCLRIASQQD